MGSCVLDGCGLFKRGMPFGTGLKTYHMLFSILNHSSPQLLGQAIHVRKYSELCLMHVCVPTAQDVLTGLLTGSSGFLPK
jgi:hypothetical protein